MEVLSTLCNLSLDGDLIGHDPKSFLEKIEGVNLVSF